MFSSSFRRPTLLHRVLQHRSSRCGLHVAARPSDLVGNTPLLDLSALVDKDDGTRLYGKLESLGPCSSVKDRSGKYMIDDAEKAGKIKPGKTVLVEPTR